MTTNTQFSTLTDGRRMALSTTGPEDGPAVVLLHSAPGSRLFDPDPAATAAAGVRLVTVDRPGYGGSDPLPAGATPTLNGIADDVAAALRAAGVLGAAVAGWSAGGRIALALAARHPELAASVTLLGTPAPDDEVPWVEPWQREMLHALREHPETAYAQLTEAFAQAPAPGAEDVAAAVSGGPADEKLLATDPAAAARVREMLLEGFRGGPAGAAADVTAANVPPSGFDPAAVTQPVHLFYGEDDVIVPPAHGEYWAGLLPQARLRPVPGAGHLLPVVCWAEVLAAVANS